MHDSRLARAKAQHLMLLIAEVKEIVPARNGFEAVIKHVPDQAFALDEHLYRSSDAGSSRNSRRGARPTTFT